MSRWRHIADWAKKRPMVLKAADRLGRGTGRFRVLDRIGGPRAARGEVDLSEWESLDAAAVWIGHATVLIRLGGMTILADPVFSNRIGLGLGLATGGPKRLRPPAIAFKSLPKLDLVLVSHAHFDHLDRPTLRRLSKRAPVVCAAGVSDLIADLGFPSVRELDWNQSLEMGGVRITGRPVIHWGARTFWDDHRGYCAFLLEAGGRRILFGGDSAMGDHFDDLSTTGGVDLAMLGIAAYNPYIAAHATPEQALAMADAMGARRIMPIHHGTFRLSYEPVNEPLERLVAAVGANGAERLVGFPAGRIVIV